MLGKITREHCFRNPGYSWATLQKSSWTKLKPPLVKTKLKTQTLAVEPLENVILFQMQRRTQLLIGSPQKPTEIPPFWECDYFYSWQFIYSRSAWQFTNCSTIFGPDILSMPTFSQAFLRQQSPFKVPPAVFSFILCQPRWFNSTQVSIIRDLRIGTQT